MTYGLLWMQYINYLLGRIMQAYLIIAHKCDETLKSLIKQIDSPVSDIFIHMDKKNVFYKEENIKIICKESNIYFTPRTNVTWGGGYSQINAELLLLDLAVKKGSYDHLHLISGEDLLLKDPYSINKFFIKNKNMEFVSFDRYEISNENIKRFKYYHILREYIGTKKGITINLYKIINRLYLIIQQILGIDRREKDICYQKGCNWISITNAFAEYVLTKKEWIEKNFKYTLACDEVFIQTLLINSPFNNNIYKSHNNKIPSNLRYIDWERGKPYIWRDRDYVELINSKCLFARKFNCEIDEKIILKINKFVKKYEKR